MNAVIREPWSLLLLALAIVGGLVSVEAVRGMVQGKLWAWLERRHERECVRRKRLWNDRWVRHAATGRVGRVAAVCTLKHGWHDLLFPRWVAAVETDPVLAALRAAALRAAALENPPLRDMIERGREVVRRVAAGGLVAMPLSEITLAPADDAEAFRAAMVVPEEWPNEGGQP